MSHRKEVERLRKRAMGFMDAAAERLKAEDYDLACFMAEQAVQLYLKSAVLELSGDVPRTHSIRQLLSILSKLLDEQFDFDRRSLIFLEDAYIKARYLGSDYVKEDAEDAIKILKR
ncbi:HEPN domain-containing protein [Archaeoglobus sp.]